MKISPPEMKISPGSSSHLAQATTPPRRLGMAPSRLPISPTRHPRRRQWGGAANGPQGVQAMRRFPTRHPPRRPCGTRSLTTLNAPSPPTSPPAPCAPSTCRSM